jgi:DNA-binding protein YbaB
VVGYVSAGVRTKRITQAEHDYTAGVVLVEITINNTEQIQDLVISSPSVKRDSELRGRL